MTHLKWRNPLPEARQRAQGSAWKTQVRGQQLLLRLLVLAAALYCLVRPFWSGAGNLDILLGAAALLGGALWSWRARNIAGASSGRIWLGLAAAQLLWAGAAIYEHPPFAAGLPGGEQVALVLTVGAQICWLYMLFVIRSHTRIAAQFAPLADALLVLIAAATLCSYFIFGPALGARDSEWLVLVPAALTLLMFGAMIFLRYMAVGPLFEAHALVFAGLLAVALGQGWQLSEVLIRDLSSPMAGATRILAGLLFLAAANEVVNPPRIIRANNYWEEFAPWLPLLYISSVVVLPLVYRRGDVGPLALFGILISLFLAVFRLGLSLAENRSLRRERTHLLRQTEEWTRLAISDPLTGLFNKGYCEYRLKAEFERSVRHQQPLALIVLDLDNFKQVNDRYGHPAGDALLIEVGKAMRTTCRTVDIACRTGGDEFVIIMPNTRVEEAAVLSDRLRNAINGVLARRRFDVAVSVSGGVAGYPQTALSSDELLLMADRALYSAKAQGKANTVVWNQATDPLAIPDSQPTRAPLVPQSGAHFHDGGSLPLVH